MRKIKFKIEVVDKQTSIENIKAKEASIDKDVLMEDEMFIKKILFDQNRHTFYVSVDIESREYNGKVVVEIGDLYWYFYKTRGLNREESRGLLYWILKEKLTLRIVNCNFNCIQSYFSIVPDDTAVTYNAQKGIDHFIETYFFNGRAMRDVAWDTRIAIINQLYNFNIASKNDCESGNLIIER
ncbi:MAG: hypothetical protein LBU83_00735 [Bacteroidales bacterium]|nr:hypothetical protein [Bacteroidales bacterium]